MRVLGNLAKAIGAAVAASALLAPAAAHAAWVKAETDRFVVYGDGAPQTVGDYARRLTIYDEMLRYMNPGVKDRPTPQKVDVYMVRSAKDLRRVAPKAGDGLAGFYMASSNGVFAIASTYNNGVGFSADTTLFHEYAHHFMLENFPAAYPAWFTEGWAEYFSTAEIKPKGITIGGYNTNRVDWLFGMPWIPMADLFTKRPGELTGNDTSLYYAQAWDFMHYMRDTPERAAQLNQAIRDITAGGDPVGSIEKATGKRLSDLTRNLKAYTLLQVITLPAKLLNMNPPVALTSLSPAADDLLLENVRLNITDPGKPDDAFLADIRARAALHPDDRLADLALARAEFLFGDVKAGEAIVTKRLVANPADLDFVRLAGDGHMIAGQRNPATRAEQYRAARPLLAKAYELNKDDFRPLYQYEISRSIEPGYPTENDENVVLQAHALAPAVDDTSILAGEVLLATGKRDDAVRVLSLVANSPHGGSAAAMARALIAGKSPEDAQAAAKATAKGDLQAPDAAAKTNKPAAKAN